MPIELNSIEPFLAAFFFLKFENLFMGFYAFGKPEKNFSGVSGAGYFVHHSYEEFSKAQKEKKVTKA